MSFIGDLLTGSRPDMALPGYATGQLDKLQQYFDGIRTDKAGKEYKHIVKQYDDDPASLASLSLSQGAVRKRELGEQYAQGANALLAQSGGEQGTILQHMRENQDAKIDEETGLNAIGEANSKYFNALGGWADAIRSRDQQKLGTLGMMGNLMASTQYDRRRQGGLFNPQTWGNALAAFAGGAGASLGA